MVEELDVSRAPRGVLAASELVEAVAKIGDLAERHFLELKGPPDLTSKTSKAKIAKFILGAANRMPDRASAAFEGCAVMIMGITADGIKGVPPIEMLELSKVIERFLGPNGPRWDIVRVPVPDTPNEVLVVVVEPPKLGQGPFPCRADGDGLSDGRFYVRADGATREVTSAEYDLLVERGNALSAIDVDFRVSIMGAVRPVTVDESATLESYIAHTRQELMAAIPVPDPVPSTPAGLAAVYAHMSLPANITGFGKEAEDRSNDEYIAEINDWEKRFRTAWPAAVDQLVGYALSSTVIQVANKTSTFFHDVEVQIHLEGSVRGVEYYEFDGSLPSVSELGLPPHPRAWGPKPNQFLNTLGPLPLTSDLGKLSRMSSPRLVWSNTDPVSLTLDAGDLRPRATDIFDEGEVVLVVPLSDHTAPVHGTWQITARDFNEVFEGELEVGIDEPADFTPLWRAVFGLADGETSEEDDLTE